MEFRISGRIRVSLMREPGFSLERVSLKNKTSEVAAAERIGITLQLIPLLRHEIKIRDLSVLGLKINIEKYKDGASNIDTEKKTEAHSSLLFEIKGLTVSRGDVLYTDHLTGHTLAVSGLELHIADFVPGPRFYEDMLRNSAFAGHFKCAGIKTKDFSTRNVSFSAKVRNGIFEISPLAIEMFGGRGNGVIAVDITTGKPEWKIQYAASKLRIERLSDFFLQEKVLSGEADLSLNLSFRGASSSDILKSMQGAARLKGENLTVLKFDPDKLLTKLEESRNFSLIDLGAYVLAGPFGSLATKGYSFANVYAESSGGRNGVIRKLFSQWRIKNGIAHAEDVALATQNHRVALKGGLDFGSGRFDNITVAVLNERGCATFSQKIAGPFSNPKKEKINVLESLAAPMLKLFSSIRELAGLKCEVFYAGSVKHPHGEAPPKNR